MIIYAVNIHVGGGKVLLNELINNQNLGSITAAFLDYRYKGALTAAFPCFYYRNSLTERFKAEYDLFKWSSKLDNARETILFFGNLPPLRKQPLTSFLYLQNCYLTRQVPLPDSNYKEFIRNYLESILLRFFAKNVNEIWVQSNWMKKITSERLPKAKIEIKKFLPMLPLVSNRETNTKIKSRPYHLMYVGNFSKNKRLSFFIEALSKLDLKIGLQIKVHIIIDQPQNQLPNILKNKIANLKKIEIKLSFQDTREQIFAKYLDSQIFVSTSLYESLCLPIYEAKHFGCQIIAPIAGYTEDIGFNIERFQAYSENELTDAIQNLLK